MCPPGTLENRAVPYFRVKFHFGPKQFQTEAYWVSIFRVFQYQHGQYLLKILVFVIHVIHAISYGLVIEESETNWLF